MSRATVFASDPRLSGRGSGGLVRDPLFVGATRPPMRWGVTYSALLFNLVFTLEAFLLTRNLLALLLALPIHCASVLLCGRDARYFDLLLLWGRTRLPALIANGRWWGASSCSPLSLDPPRSSGRRRAIAAVVIPNRLSREWPPC